MIELMIALLELFFILMKAREEVINKIVSEV